MKVRGIFRLSAACLVAWALSGCASTPPDEDPVQIRLKDLDTRLVRIERVMANQSLLEVSNQLEALRSDVRAMHNDVDQLSNALESGRKQQRDLYARGFFRRCRTGSGQWRRRGGRCSRRLLERRGQGRLPGGVHSAEGRPIRPGHRCLSKIPGNLSRQLLGR